METIKLKIVETKEEALEAYSLFTEVHLKQNHYYVELMKNPNFVFDATILYEYYIHNIGRMISQQLCFIAVDTAKNKVVSVICGEDLFEEPNPDYPLNKPMVIKLNESLSKMHQERFIKEGLIEIKKGEYVHFGKVTTHPHYQKGGIICSLFQLALNTVKERGFKYLYTAPSHDLSIKLVFEKLYATEIGRTYYKDIEYEGMFPFDGLFKDFKDPYIAIALKQL
jgi:hypothetical protein